MDKGNATETSKEQQVKKLKGVLAGWRMALLSLRSIMLWDRQWHPCAIVSVTSILYLLIWLLDFNSLTTLAAVGAIINMADFIVPIACNSIYGSNSWNGTKEKGFEDICRSIVIHFNRMWHHITSFFALRETSPLVYYTVSICSLFGLAWVASAVNGIILMYVLTLCLMMYPGVQSRGICNTLISLVKRKGDKEK